MQGGLHDKPIWTERLQFFTHLQFNRQLLILDFWVKLTLIAEKKWNGDVKCCVVARYTQMK